LAPAYALAVAPTTHAAAIANLRNLSIRAVPPRDQAI